MLRHVFADGGYAGDKLKGRLAKFGQWTMEIVKRSDKGKGRAGSVCLNSFGRFAKWISASIMLPPSSVSAR